MAQGSEIVDALVAEGYAGIPRFEGWVIKWAAQDLQLAGDAIDDSCGKIPLFLKRAFRYPDKAGTFLPSEEAAPGLKAQRTSKSGRDGFTSVGEMRGLFGNRWIIGIDSESG